MKITARTATLVLPLALTLGLAAGLARAGSVTINVNTTLTEANGNTYSSDDVTVDGAITLTLSNSATRGTLVLYNFGSLTVTNGASVVCLGQGAMSPYDDVNKGVAIGAGNVTVAAGCSINADGKGFNTTSKGPGYTQYKGATHGGIGWDNPTNTYGSATSPASLGSASQANGGGAIKLIVSGNLIVNGTLSADGIYSYEGSGSGGSIWIANGGTLSGNGTISARGGMGTYTEGGGGRIAMDDAVTYSFTGNILCGKAGGKSSGNPGSVRLPGNQAITVVSNQTLVLGNGAFLNVFTDLTIAPGGRVEVGGIPMGLGTGSVIEAANLNIQTGGVLTADFRGFGYSSAGDYRGPGTPRVTNKGATHGGIGWANTNNTYGSATSPTSLGSGAYAAFGGGGIKLVVSGSLIVNGTLSADGAYDWLGSGAGGSIWIANGGTFSGNGTISAKSSGSVPGGGGRIAIDDTVAYNFTGNILGGATNGSVSGNPGSVRLPQNQAITVVSNQTLVLGDGAFTNVFSDLTIANGGRVEVGGIPRGLGTGSVIRAANLNIQTGGVLTADYRGFGYSFNNQSYTGPGTPGAQSKGATHGGIGYNNTTGTYGSATAPTSLGSDGYQAFGGGAIQLIVLGNLTVNGTLSANGTADWQGCASGGSLWIESRDTLSGNGVISANGGTGVSGGGGGRVAIYYASSSFTGLPAVGVYTQRQDVSASVLVKGGYNTSTNGPEDGSICIGKTQSTKATVFSVW